MSMSNCSKNRITKNVYLNILGACQTSVKDQFMERGGWHLIFAWTNSAIATKNYDLLKEILNLLLGTPVTIPRLKSNRFVVIFRQLSKTCADEEVRGLCKEVLARWRKTANELQNRVILKEDVKLVGGDASMTAEEEAGAVPQSADGGEGGSGQHRLAVTVTGNNLVGWKDEFTPKDTFDESKVIQQNVSPPPSPVPEPQVVTTCVLVSSPSSPKKIMISSSPSTKDFSTDSKAYDVADHVQDKKVKKQKDRRLERINRRKAKAAAKRTTKEAEKQMEQDDKGRLKKISYVPPSPAPSSSSSSCLTSTSEWKIPKKLSNNLGDSIPAALVTKPLKLAKQLKEVNTKKPAATKKVKLEKMEDKQFMMMVAEQRSQVPQEIKKNEASVDWKAGGGEQILKSCLVLNRPEDKAKKCVSWKTPIEDFDEVAAAGGGNGVEKNGQDRNCRNGDHQTNDFGGSRNFGDFLRIDGNGKLIKRKPSETLCFFFQKGRCDKGIRCNYLHDGATTSTPAIQIGKPFSSPLLQASDHHHRNGGSDGYTNNSSSSKVNGQGPNKAKNIKLDIKFK